MHRAWFKHSPREVRDTLFTLAVIALVVAPHAARLPWWCHLLTWGVLLWRSHLALRQRPLPGKWLRLCLLGLALLATVLTYRSMAVREAGVTLVVTLLALKTLELRQRRDLVVLFFLGLFALLTQLVFSQSLLSTVWIVAGLWGLLTMLILAHQPAGRPALTQSARIAAQLALLGVPIMLVLFVLFPRLAPLWGLPGEQPRGRSGLSQSMQVGSVASLALDDSVALRVRFIDPAPPASALYFRGPVLSVFDGRTWQALPLGPEAQRPTNTQPLAVRTNGPVIRYEVTQEPLQQPWLITLEATTSAPLLPGSAARMGADLLWQRSASNNSSNPRLRYQAVSHTAFSYGPAQREQVSAVYVQLPAGSNPRTQAWAAQWRAQSAKPDAPEQALAWVQAALQHLRQGDYRYTLEPGLFGPDSADEFWFDQRAGFCEHVASAFVVLMRALGVPARIVTGYLGGEINPIDGLWTVRQSDAHAWAEVWLPGPAGSAGSWTRVDPTAALAPSRVQQLQRLSAAQGLAARTLSPSLAPAWARQLRSAWEAINHGWNQRVLNYTQAEQLNLLKRLGWQNPSTYDLASALLLVLASLGLAGVAAALLKRHRTDPWQRLLSRARTQLRRAGLAFPAHCTPRCIAEQLQSRNSAQAHAWVQWLLRLEAQRYDPNSNENMRDLRRTLNRLSWPTAHH